MYAKARWTMVVSIIAALAACPAALRAATYSGTPYSGTPAPLPGTVPAENFDNGGEGVAYHDSTPGNSGSVYRSTDVDIEPSTEGNYDIGYITSGEWLNYTVKVAASGTYSVQLRVASQSTGGTIHVGFNSPSNVWVPVTVPSTGAWQSWTTVSFSTQLAAGVQQMTLYFDSGSLNVNSVTVASPTSSAMSTPYSGAPVSLPGSIEAENFDNGGEGVAYHDTTAGNSGGAYRNTDVDVQTSTEGGYNIGYITAGEWLNYSVVVAASGTYTVQLRVASLAGGTLHVGFNGSSTVWVPVVVPATGGWQNWTTVSASVAPAAGPQVMTLYFDTPSFNVNSITVASAAPPPTQPSTTPAISLTSPTGGSSYTAPATVALAATASTPSGTSITRVDFYAGSTLIGTDTASPYTLSWSGVAAGTYSITAKVTNSAGKTATSSAVSISVGTAAQTLTTVTFTPPADNTTDVTSYTLDIFTSGANPASASPVKSQSLGKPSIASGQMSANVASLIASLSPGSYFATVTAVGPGGSTRSAASNTFTR